MLESNDPLKTTPSDDTETKSPEIHNDSEQSTEYGQHKKYPKKTSSERPKPKGRFKRGHQSRRKEIDPKIVTLIRNTEANLKNSYEPAGLSGLDAFERKQVHRHFERLRTDYQTKTYRDGDNYILWIFPVATLKEFVESKAKEAIDNGKSVSLPTMSNYERFLIHDFLKDNDRIETISIGEGDSRYIEIHPKKFGRKLKNIIRKIKFF